MTWAKLSDTFYDDPNVDNLSLEAVGAFALMLSYCGKHETDGKISPSRARSLARGRLSIVNELVDGRFLEGDGTSLFIRSWAKYQPTRQQLRERRARWAARQRALRRAVIERDGGVCYLCGVTCAPFDPSGPAIHVEHIVPLARVGEDSTDNLAVACGPCNIRKGAALLSDLPWALPNQDAGA